MNLSNEIDNYIKLIKDIEFENKNKIDSIEQNYHKTVEIKIENQKADFQKKIDLKTSEYDNLNKKLVIRGYGVTDN